jgi:hypothetical protein
MRRRTSHTQAQILPITDVSITREAQYITDRAIECDSRIVTLGPLVLFSTETGDGWMLDPVDHLAVCLARDGSRLPVGIDETDESFAIEWTHAYQIDGELMTFVDPSGNAQMMWGYPTREIEQAIRRAQW